MRVSRLLAALAAIVAGPAVAQPAITDADARSFVARLEADWNAGRLDPYFDAFARDAVFTDQAYVGTKPPVPYGAVKAPEARINARRAFARKPWPREAGRILRVEPAQEGAIRVVSAVGSIVWQDGRPRRTCASRALVLALTEGALRATSRTDTFVRCRRG